MMKMVKAAEKPSESSIHQVDDIWLVFDDTDEIEATALKTADREKFDSKGSKRIMKAVPAGYPDLWIKSDGSIIPIDKEGKEIKATATIERP